MHVHKAIVRPHCNTAYKLGDHIVMKDTDTLERIQRRSTNTIPEMRCLSYEERLEECGLTTLETRMLREDQIKIIKILNGYEHIDKNSVLT